MAIELIPNDSFGFPKLDSVLISGKKARVKNDLKLSRFNQIDPVMNLKVI